MVTLHNHIRIGDGSKPVIPNAEFKKLCEMAEDGNLQYCIDINEKYCMVPFQKQLINQLLNEKNLPPLL